MSPLVPDFNAGQSRYRVMFRNKEFSSHTTEREAAEVAGGLKLANPKVDVRYTHDYTVTVTLKEAPAPVPEPTPEPQPEPEPPPTTGNTLPLTFEKLS